jgi:hypothetical protein
MKPATTVDPVSQNCTAPSEEVVRLNAYLNWVAARRPEGDGVNFWLEAEKQLSVWT